MARWLALLLDGLAFLATTIWAIGGIPWNGKILLSHGADLRRGVVIVLAVLLCVPALYRHSRFVSLARCFVDAFNQNRSFQFACFFSLSAFLGFGAIAQTYAFRFSLYDVGIFHQAIWNFAQNGKFFTSISGSGDHLRDHLSLTFALFAPFFVTSLPWMLPLIHALLHVLTIAAWVKLAERFHCKFLPAFVFLFGLCMNSLYANLWWGFHETAIIMASISWFLVAVADFCFDATPMTLKRFCAALLLLITAGLSKESALLDGALLALIVTFFCWRQKQRKRAAVLIATAVIFVGIFFYYAQLPKPADKNYFLRYYSYLGNNVGDMLRNLVLHPGTVVDRIGWRQLLQFPVTLLLPWLFLPLVYLRKYFLWLLPIAPNIVMMALSTHPDLRQEKFHYVLVLWPFFCLMTIATLARLNSVKLCCAWVLLNAYLLTKDPVMSLQQSLREMSTRADRALLQEVPKNVTIAAEESTGPWIADRLAVVRWPDLAFYQRKCPEWVILKRGDERQRDLCLDANQTPENSSERWLAYRVKKSYPIMSYQDLEIWGHNTGP